MAYVKLHHHSDIHVNICLLDCLLLDGYIYPVTWGSLCGNIHRHSWAVLPHIDSSDAHRVSSVRAQVMERVRVDGVEQIRVLCSVGFHVAKGELHADTGNTQ